MAYGDMDFNSTFASINSFGGVDYAPHNRGITPVFFVEPVLDEAATEREGRTVYRDLERVRIYIAGDSLSAATHPVDAQIIARFHDQYTAWKSKKTGAHISGMPLSKWPMATPGLIKECEFLNIYSVEDLAAVSDGNISNLSDGRPVREKAIAWLKSATDGAAAMKYAAEAERLRDRVAELEKTVRALAGDESSGRTRSLRDNEDDRPRSLLREPRTKRKRRKSAWTQERRKAASEAVKARGGVVPKRPATVDEFHAALDEA